MAAQRKIPICLVGLGRIGRLHLNHLLEMPDRVVVLAVCDARAQAVDEVRASPGLKGYTDFQAMLDQEKPEALVIATSAQSHSRLIEEAASRQIHIFCEKPLALSLPEARQAARAVSQSFFQIGFQRRFDRAYRDAYQKIRAGVIGEPITFKATARDAWEPDLEFARVEVSGGLLLDMAIHDFDLARWLMGTEVTGVSTAGSSLLYSELPAVGDVDSAVVNLTFQSGAIGNVEAGRTGTFGYDIRTEVVGTQGALFVGHVENSSLVIADSQGFHRSASANYRERFLEAYKTELREFVDCVLQDRKPDCSVEEGIKSLEIALAARESLENKKPVSV
jgi:predicted dehydrogenase